MDGRRGHQADPGVANVFGAGAALAAPASASPPAHALTNARATTRPVLNEWDAVDDDTSDLLVGGAVADIRSGREA